MRDALNARGAKTIRGLAIAFKTIDSYDGNRKVDRDEFLVGLQEMGVQLTKSEAFVRFISRNLNDIIRRHFLII